jgi:hypothetical protein
VGLEIEPIEDQLEIELGASHFRPSGATVWDVDVTFKKPWRLAESLEVLPGIGPTWEHTSQASARTNTWGAEVVVDFFFWRGRRWGWYAESAYGVAFASGNARSATITIGLFANVP